MEKRKKILKYLLIALGAVAGLLVIAVCVYMLWEKAPEPVSSQPTASPTVVKSTQPPMDEGMPLETDRQDGVYTILLAGTDNGSGNTDAIIVGRIDTVNHKMDFVSIPRDTVINVDWGVRKLNSVYWGAKSNEGNGPEALVMHTRWLTGFNVDCYAVADLAAFELAVDAMGGIDVNVEKDIDYDDPFQSVYVHVKKGRQHLTGFESICYLRYRAGYITGDLGRIETQQGFLRDAATQFVTLGNIPNASKVAKIVSERTDTNLSSANVAFFLRQAMMCKSEDISFHIMPVTSANLQGYSYAIPLLGEWVDMINQCLNPFQEPVSANNLNLIFYNGGKYGCTGVMKGEWYFKPPQPTPALTPQPNSQPEPTTGPTIITVEPTPPGTPSAEPGDKPEATVKPEPTVPPTPVPTEEPGVTPPFAEE